MIYIPSVFLYGAVETVNETVGHAADWRAVLGQSGPVMLILDGGHTRWDGNDDFQPAKELAVMLLHTGIADGWPVRRVPGEDILSQAEVIDLLNERAPKGNVIAFAKSAGVSLPAITQIKVGDRRPGESVLNALGLLRIPRTDLYMRRQPDQRGWKSDQRGGRGGTVSANA